MDYKLKYLKYKQKYLKMKGGQLVCGLKRVGDPDSTYLPDISNYERLYHTLTRKVNMIKTIGINTLWLKIGSNDTVPYQLSKKYNLYHSITPNSIINLEGDNTTLLNTFIKRNVNKYMKNPGMLLSIDPRSPSSKIGNINNRAEKRTFLNDIIGNLNNIIDIKEVPADGDIKEVPAVVGYGIIATFPLSPGMSRDGGIGANHIIKYLANLDMNLVLINAMGSACYSSIKALLDNRRSDYFTDFFLMVDNPDNAICGDVKIYDSEENYKKCYNEHDRDKYVYWDEQNINKVELPEISSEASSSSE